VIWEQSNRFDPRAVAIADRHYNRQKPGTNQFVPPGSNVVFMTPDERALWVTICQEHVRHAWPGAWVNSLFRNEGAGLSSALIREAVAATRALWPAVPDAGIITFVDGSKIRRKRDPGRCYRKAGWRHVGFTQERRLYVFQQLPAEMPDPEMPTLGLWRHSTA